MTERGRLPICDDCLSYIAGLCSEEEKRVFELHLPTCDSCRQELEDLHIVWEALPANMEMMEPPKDLKQQVMKAVRAADAESADGGKTQSNRLLRPFSAGKSRRSRLPRGMKPMLALFAAAASAIVLLSIWNAQLRSEHAADPLPVEQALSVPASNIKQLVSLKSQAPETAESSGVACIVDNGQSKQFVVYLFGAPPTLGEEAYQVWLIKDGKRSSAGTFRVGSNSRGIGLLAMPIQGKKLDFDAIGITLEPDEHGSQPRGTRMYGSVS
ncbi:anti-sigma factor [Paenibacillus rhizovicinus]|uniref:Anti-sigma-W factor RsiW n=1 Tax=Paenibacillus rhizovicinus TaxID=2704463 RepID=A0A6C0PAB1_9BACL|nr:anti-sigma factor [Paenibacillus rhizovicinus]QHW35311.1 anti-sigma factor [Paenibacillus rhizovicinus]